MKDQKIELPDVPFIFQYGQYNEDDLRQPDCRLIPYRDFQEVMRAYARVAIEADRKLRGEPIAWVKPDIVENQFINMRPRRVWWECNEGIGMAIYTAPQHAKPSSSGRLRPNENPPPTYDPPPAPPPPPMPGNKFRNISQPAEPVKEPKISTTQALITLGKVVVGYRPGEEGWTNYDQQVYDAAMSVSQPLSERDILAERISDLSAEQIAEILTTYITPEIIGDALEKLENAPWELSAPVKVDAKRLLDQ